MDEKILRAYIAGASAVAGFWVGSVLMNRAMRTELKRRAVLESNAFRRIADKLADLDTPSEEVMATMSEELKFLMIALEEK